MLQPVKEATPATACSLRPACVQDSVAPAVPVPGLMATPSSSVLEERTAPLASRTDRVGCVLHVAPATPPFGWSPPKEIVAGPLTTTVPLVAEVSPALVALILYLPPLLILQPANEAV